MSQYLTPEHPSFSCDQAWFLFAVKNHRGPGFCRLIIVEAKNHAAVAFLERVSTTDGDPSVSDTVSLVSVHRQCPVIGIRSPMLEEIDFKVFANDIVDRERISRDPLIVQAYRDATSPVRAVRQAPPPPARAVRPAQPPSARTHTTAVRDELLSSLSDLGFKGKEADSMVSSLGRLDGRPMVDLIRAAIRARKSAAV